MINVGIVGCGKVADQHAAQISRIRGARILAVCDSEPMMADQMKERYHAESSFTDVRRMLDQSKVDVVHITTPPQSHFELGKLCLTSGRHVYIQKPFTLNTPDAETLVEIATRTGLKLTAGHNAQFTHAMTRMRRLVDSGYLGGRPVHMESIYCYEFGDQSYAKALLGDRGHWVRTLPGSLLQNIISHGIGKVAEFLSGDRPLVHAHGFTSKFLQDIGQGDIVDEVRVTITDELSTTAYFTFSSQISPSLHQFRLYGPKRSVIVDDDHQVLIKLDNREYKSFSRYFIPPLGFAGQYLQNLRTNAVRFMKNDFHLPFDAGLNRLITAFYASIESGAPLPLSYREILLTARIMDDIFAQVKRPSPRPEVACEVTQ
jgi:predicted dehydrogenase